MTVRTCLAALALTASLGACATYDDDGAVPITRAFNADAAPLEAEIIGARGNTIGVVVMTEGPNGILGSVSLNAGAVAPGWHGLHVHQVGDCSDVGTFTNSGGHLGKIEGGHGLLNPTGPEAGDLPNLHAADNGSAAMEFFTDRFSLAEIREGDGSALILHQNRDDHITQPIGGAGPRVGCAVLD